MKLLTPGASGKLTPKCIEYIDLSILIISYLCTLCIWDIERMPKYIKYIDIFKNSFRSCITKIEKSIVFLNSQTGYY